MWIECLFRHIGQCFSCSEKTTAELLRNIFMCWWPHRESSFTPRKKKIPIPVCLTFSPVFFNIALKSCAKQSQIQEHGSIRRSKQTSVISRCKITEHLRFSILKVQEKHNNRSVKEKDCTELKFVRKLPKPKQRQCSVWHIGTVFH